MGRFKLPQTPRPRPHCAARRSSPLRPASPELRLRAPRKGARGCSLRVRTGGFCLSGRSRAQNSTVLLHKPPAGGAADRLAYCVDQHVRGGGGTGLCVQGGPKLWSSSRAHSDSARTHLHARRALRKQSVQAALVGALQGARPSSLSQLAWLLLLRPTSLPPALVPCLQSFKTARSRRQVGSTPDACAASLPIQHIRTNNSMIETRRQGRALAI